MAQSSFTNDLNNKYNIAIINKYNIHQDNVNNIHIYLFILSYAMTPKLCSLDEYTNYSIIR